MDVGVTGRLAVGNYLVRGTIQLSGLIEGSTVTPDDDVVYGAERDAVDENSSA